MDGGARLTTEASTVWTLTMGLAIAALSREVFQSPGSAAAATARASAGSTTHLDEGGNSSDRCGWHH